MIRRIVRAPARLPHRRLHRGDRLRTGFREAPAALLAVRPRFCARSAAAGGRSGAVRTGSRCARLGGFRLRRPNACRLWCNQRRYLLTGSLASVDARGVADHQGGVLPPAGELDGVGGSPARGELDGETDAATVGGPPPLEAGRGAGGGEPAVDLVDAEADDRIPRFRRDRGVQAADRGRAAADQTSHIRTPPGRVGLRAADGDNDVVAVAEIDVGPAECGDLTATESTVEQQGDDRTVDQAAALGGLRALEAAAGAARAEAGGEDGGALVGGQTASLAAAGRRVGRVRSPELLEGVSGERPAHERSTLRPRS